MLYFGFLGDCKRVNRSILYSFSMWLAGLGLALVPLSRNSLSFAVLDGIYGFFTAASEALSCIIVDDILGTSSLSDGYGILMLIQGIANLGGPPLAGTGTHTQTHVNVFLAQKIIVLQFELVIRYLSGWLFDISGSYNNTFFAAGGSIVFLGMLFEIVPIHSRLYKQNTCKIN